MTKLSWHTEKRRVADLVPNDKNPRTMSPKQIEDLKKSLKRFNLVELPAIDTNNKVLAGHQRLMVLKLLGRENEMIEVRVPNRKLTKIEYDQYLLTSNRVHGDWDWSLLKEFDIDLLTDVGFDADDISNIWDEQLEIQDDDFDINKELKKIGKPKTKTGDIITLGKHRLICGDSTNPETLTTLLGKKSVEMIYTDPPYNIALSYTNGIGTKGKYGGMMTNDRKSNLEYQLFLHKAFENVLAHANKDCHFFSYCDETYIGLVQSLFSELGLTNRRVCLWIKNNQNPTPQVAFNKAYEPCVYGTRGKPYLSPTTTNLNEVLNKEIGTGNQLPNDILDLWNIWLSDRVSGTRYEHPTEKPPTLHEKALRRCTKPGDTVLDLFGGSGSTLIACEQMKRTAYLVEQEPIFCDLIIRRYEALSRKKEKGGVF